MQRVSIYTKLLGEHPMQCFIKRLLESEESKNNNQMCEPFPPLVKSMIGGLMFLSLMLAYLVLTAA